MIFRRPIVVNDPPAQGLVGATVERKLRQQTVYVVGAGISGVTTAYELARQGFHVVVLEARPSFGTQCTAACGSAIPLQKDFHYPPGNQLRLSATESFKGWWYYSRLRHYCLSIVPFNWIRNNGIKLKRRLWIAQKNDPFFERLKPTTALTESSDGKRPWMAQRALQWTVRWSSILFDPFFWWWSASAVRHRKANQEQRDLINTVSGSLLTWSLKRLQDVIQQERFGHHLIETAVHCKLCTTEKAWKDVQNEEITKNTRKFDQLINPASLMSLFPLLSQSPLPFFGAVRYDDVPLFHVNEFLVELTRVCEQKYGVQFAYNTPVTGFETQKNGDRHTVTGCVTANGDVIPLTPSSAYFLSGETSYHDWLSSCSPVILATGAWTPRLCANLGVLLPVYPVRRLSVLLPLPEHLETCGLWKSQRSAAAVKDRVVDLIATRNMIRASGFADLGGWGVQSHPKLEKSLINRLTLLQILCPENEKITRFAVVVGLQPLIATPAEYIVGQLPGITNAFVNVAATHNAIPLSLGLAAVLAQTLRALYVKPSQDLPSCRDSADCFPQLNAFLEGDAGCISSALYSPFVSKLCSWWWQRKRT